MTHTLTIGVEQTQLHTLIRDAQNLYQPVILTNEASTVPLALLAPLVNEQRDQANIIQHLIEGLENLLQVWQQDLDIVMSGHYAQLFLSQLRLLSQNAPEDVPLFGSLVMLLRLAIRQLDISVSVAQLEAIQFGLHTLKQSNLNADHIDQVDQVLLQNEITARANLGDNKLLRQYVEAL